MKIQILKVLVLLVSISAASVLVWNATREQKPKQTQEDDKISPKKLQGSSKMKTVITADIIETMDSDSTVTDEEVKRMRDAMLSTSKSGIIMSDDKIREILEEQKKERKLMPSSKSIDAILTPKDVEGFIEGSKPEKKQEPHLIPSSKNPNRLLDPKDVEKIIERSASDFIKPLESEKK